SVVGGTNTFTITATRKTGTAAGKNPSGARAYTVTLNQSGVLNVSGF
ncbi:MAG: hypothetical protein HYZ90_04735, partial [Candidatus Omnitrophica bacterium]|nr:hypothetical protein [Candidatus Omnitrophota bacterium]